MNFVEWITFLISRRVRILMLSPNMSINFHKVDECLRYVKLWFQDINEAGRAMNKLLERGKNCKPQSVEWDRQVRLWNCDSAGQKALLLGQPLLELVAIWNSPVWNDAFRENRKPGKNLAKSPRSRQNRIPNPSKSKSFNSFQPAKTDLSHGLE